MPANRCSRRSNVMTELCRNTTWGICNVLSKLKNDCCVIKDLTLSRAIGPMASEFRIALSQAGERAAEGLISHLEHLAPAAS